MDTITTDFDNFEQVISEILGQMVVLLTSQERLKEANRSEAARAEAAEVARAAALSEAVDSHASAEAALATAKQASASLATALDELTTLKSKIQISERQIRSLEEKCCELKEKLAASDTEIQQLRSKHAEYSVIQRQYEELEGRVQAAIDEMSSEANRLGEDMCRLEKVARGGVEVRERARLAAAAHARERRCAAEELKLTTLQLQKANEKIVHLVTNISKLQQSLLDYKNEGISKVTSETQNDVSSLAEIQAALEVQRAEIEKLERNLATSLATNAELAALVHKSDNPVSNPDHAAASKENCEATNIDPIDSFLAD